MIDSVKKKSLNEDELEKVSGGVGDDQQPKFDVGDLVNKIDEPWDHGIILDYEWNGGTWEWQYDVYKEHGSYLGCFGEHELERYYY